MLQLILNDWFRDVESQWRPATTGRLRSFTKDSCAEYVTQDDRQVCARCVHSVHHSIDGKDRSCAAQLGTTQGASDGFKKKDSLSDGRRNIRPTPSSSQRRFSLACTSTCAPSKSTLRIATDSSQPCRCIEKNMECILQKLKQGGSTQWLAIAARMLAPEARSNAMWKVTPSLAVSQLRISPICGIKVTHGPP